MRMTGESVLQIALVGVTATILILGSDWGLPSRKRFDLLLAGTPVTPQLLEALDASTGEYFEERARADERSLRKLEEGRVPDLHRVEAPDSVYTSAELLRTFRRFVVGSSAVDERETYIALGRMEPARFDFNPHGFMYGGAYLYPVGGVLWLLRLLGLFHPDSGIGHFLAHPEELRAMYLAGRSLNVLAFLGTMVLLGLTARRLGSPRLGILAMLAWGMSTLPLNLALVSKPHVWAAFWIALMIHLLPGYILEGRRGSGIGAGVALGLAAGSNIFSAAMGSLPVALLVERDPARSLRRLAPVLISALATYLITNPYVLLDPRPYAASILHHGSGEGWGYAVAEIPSTLACVHDLLVRSFAFPLAILGVAQAIVLLFRSGSWDFWKRLALGWLLAFVIVALFVGVARILVFVGPALCLFAAHALDRVFRHERFRQPARRRLAGALALGPGLLFAGLFAADTLDDDAWYEPAAHWIASLSERDAPTIGVYGLMEPQDFPALPFLRVTLLNVEGLRAEKTAPDYVLIGSSRKMGRSWSDHPLHAAYELSHVLGDRPTAAWLSGLRTESLSRTAAWVYSRKGSR